MTELKNKIEDLRNELYQLLGTNKLTDIKVVIISQELDKLLAQYAKNEFQTYK